MATSPSPPLTPARTRPSPLTTSPAYSFREHLRRRSSSFSSNHDRSPVTPRSKHRFSNASISSNDLLPTPVDERGIVGLGMGNLADELEDLDDEEEEYYDEEVTEDDLQRSRGEEEVKEARDSGIDVSYTTGKQSRTQSRNFSKPFSVEHRPPDKEAVEEEKEERLSPELEDLMHTIARMTSYTSTGEDPLVPRTIALLQDLGNQSALEAGAQRLNTSTSSMTTHLAAQSKTLQSLSTSLYTPLLFAAPLDAEAVDDIMPLIDALVKDLPVPDPAPFQGLQKLDRETANVIATLSQLTDTLQMGKQTTTAASRHLRTTQMIVAELRRERERADNSRFELGSDTALAWENKVRRKWCATECHDVLSGFESVCESLRGQLVEAVGAAA